MIRVHVIGRENDGTSRRLALSDFSVRHNSFISHPHWREYGALGDFYEDAFDHDGSTHIVISDEGEIVGGSRLTPLSTPNLLQTVFNGLVQGEFPAPTSLGADWTRFFVDLDRCEGTRLAPESAALLFHVMQHALHEGYAYITFVSSGPLIALVQSVGWETQMLGQPMNLGGRQTAAFWIEVSAQALEAARHAYLVPDSDLPPSLPELFSAWPTAFG